MYERNAIVLERYFDKLFKFGELKNLKKNYSNYCNLIENIEKFKTATAEEELATKEFNDATEDIKRIQKNGEKLYNKSAKLEYSRYIIFENVEEKSDEIQRCLEKIENDVEKNITALENLDKEFMISSDNYKNKKEILLNAQEENRKAKKNFENILEQTSLIFEGILDEDIELAKEFVSSDNRERKKELNGILTENGINERNPFDNDVISNSVNVSFEIYKKEIDIYLGIYDKTKKVLSEIEEDNVKIDKHRKAVNDSTAKIDFLNAEKEYIIGFLDNERIAAIYEKKVHRKLMLEACRNLNSDLAHIDSLYDIILKEAASRSSKRLYKDNYNKSYLTDIEKVSENVQEETNKLKANAVAVMNLNYWRIEGITRIQEVFERDVKEIYGRDLEEIFPKEEAVEEIDQEPIASAEDNNSENGEKDKSVIKSKKYSKLKSSKKMLQDAIKNLEKTNEDSNESEKEDKTNEVSDELETEEKIDDEKSEPKIWSFKVDDEDPKEEENNSSEGDYSGLFEKISMLDELDEDNIEIGYKDISQPLEAASNGTDKVFSKVKINEGNEFDAFQKFDEAKNEEESVLDIYFNQANESDRKRRLNDEKQLNKDEKTSIFKKIILGRKNG